MLAYQPPLTPAEAQEIIGVVELYRHVVLRDSTPVNFCAVAGFWSANGEFLGPRELTRFHQRADCSATQLQEPRAVIITGLNRSPGRDVITSTTIRGGTKIFEQYVVLRGPASREMRGHTYTVVGITQD